jgi:lipoprotein NlpI
LGDIDKAIADYSEAIRLKQDFAVAYYRRGLAYVDKGDFQQAIADYGEAGRLNPDHTAAHFNRATLSYQVGDVDQAIAALDALLESDPTDPDALFLRGIAHLSRDSPANAVSDFERVVRQGPSDAQAVLWRDIAERRDGWPGQLGEAVSLLDMEEWPAPIVRFYLGQAQSDEVFAAAKDQDPKVQQNQLCEAHLFIGEHALLEGDKAGAKRQFELARDTCDKNYTEYGIALAELQRLDADEANQASETTAVKGKL